MQSWSHCYMFESLLTVCETYKDVRQDDMFRYTKNVYSEVASRTLILKNYLNYLCQIYILVSNDM